MSYWWVPMAISAASAIANRASSSSQNKNQAAWNRYNAESQYGIDTLNNSTALALGQMNAALAMKAGDVNAALALHSGKIDSLVAQRTADYNAAMLTATAQYNDSLLESELSSMWETAELDLMLLDNQRQVERGQIVAEQAASGTVIGEGSNADVLIDQRTQAELDAFVVRHNADVQAASISNARAQGMWEAQVGVQHTIWQGQMESYYAVANSEIRAQGIKANAALDSAAMGASSSINYWAGTQSANLRRQAGIAGASLNYNQNQQTISNNFVQGMFSAAASGASRYYQYKQTNGSQGSSLLTS